MKTEEFKEWLEERYPDEKSKAKIDNIIDYCTKVDNSYSVNLDTGHRRILENLRKKLDSTHDMKEVSIDDTIPNGIIVKAGYLYLAFAVEHYHAFITDDLFENDNSSKNDDLFEDDNLNSLFDKI